MAPYENIYYDNANDKWNMPGLHKICAVSLETLENTTTNKIYVQTITGLLQKFFDPNTARTQNAEVIEPIWSAWQKLELANARHYSKQWITHYPFVVTKHIKKHMSGKLNSKELLSLLHLSAQLAEAYPNTRGIIRNLAKRLEQRAKHSNAVDLWIHKVLKVDNLNPEENYWKTLLDDSSGIAKEMRTLYALSYAGYLVEYRSFKQDNLSYSYSMPDKNSHMKTTVSVLGERWERVFYATGIPETPSAQEVNECATLRNQWLAQAAIILDHQQRGSLKQVLDHSLEDINSYNTLSDVLYDQAEKVAANSRSYKDSLFYNTKPSRLSYKITAARLWCKEDLIWTDTLVLSALESTAPLIEDYCAKHKIKPQKIQDLCVFLLEKYMTSKNAETDTNTHRILRHISLLEPNTLLKLLHTSKEQKLIWICLSNPWALKQQTREIIANSSALISLVGDRLASEAGLLMEKDSYPHNMLNYQHLPVWAQNVMAFGGKVGDALQSASFTILNLNKKEPPSIKDITKAYFNYLEISLDDILSLYHGFGHDDNKVSHKVLVPFIENALAQKQNISEESITIPEFVFE